MAKIVQAVKCDICHRLHEKGSASYLELSGKLMIPRSDGYGHDYSKFLGSETDPTILCRGVNNNASQGCLLKFLGLTDDGY